MPMSTSRRRGVFSLGKYRFPVVGASTRHLSQLVQPTSSSSQQQQQLLDSGSGGGSSSKAVKYTPCSRQGSQLDNDELEEIAVVSVSGVESGQLTYGTAGTSMVNGPRVVPGIITSARLMEDRLSGSASRINAPGSTTGLLAGSETPRSGVSGGAVGGGTGGGTGGAGTAGGSGGSGAVSVGLGGLSSLGLRNRSFSKHSLLDIVSSRISNTVGVGNSTALKGKRFSRESFSASCVNKTTQDLSAGELTTRKTREARRRDLKNKWKLDRWENGGGAVSSHSHRGVSSAGCKWTFVFDPAGRLCYYWSMIVSLAFLYNFWVLIYRFAFQEIAADTLVMWLCLDYFCDLIYVLDIAFHFRTGYLDEGVLQTDSNKLRQNYMNSTTFYVDCLCLLPLDFLYLSIGFNSMLRCFRLVKIYRFWMFMDRTERHTNYPNVFRSISLVHYLLVIFHWNACLYHIVMRNNGFEHASGNWELPAAAPDNDGVQQYLQSFYMCTLTLTTMGGFLKPRTKAELVFVIVQLIFGLMLFATVLGHVSNIVINVSAARKEFQAKLDAVKTYMRMRRVPQHLQVKVIKWFDYLWFTQKSSDEEKAVGGLPDKLKAEIAIHVHLDTLKRVEIFQNTEAGFLCELVLRLRPVLFSPGDYICRKGEVGKEMYIVNRGRLQVVADNGKTVLATLKAGSYFGEISILNMGTAGNRRTASVRSVGYSDLFVLSKKDMWDVLKEYPAARVRLEAIAVKRLEKYKKAPLEKAALGRSLSTPGLVESKGRIPLERMQLTPSTGHRVHAPHVTDREKEASPSNVIIRSRDPSSSSSIESHNSALLGRRIPHNVNQQSLLRFSESSQNPSCSEAVVNMGMSSESDGRCTVTSMSLIHSSVTSPAFGNHPSILPLSTRQPMSLVSTSHQDGRRSSSASSTATLRGGAAASGTRGGAPTDAILECKTQLQPEVLVAEINRLRERLMTLESENAFLSTKLNRQQWEVENRLAEIEMQICGAASPVESAADDNERNYESAI